MTATLTTTTEYDASAGPRGISRLRELAIGALARMYRPKERLFAFRIRRTKGGDVMEGVSRRYTAMALIGLATQPDDVTADILAGRTPSDVCGHLLDDIDRSEDIGEVALTLWAARALEHPAVAKALGRLRAMDPVRGQHPTVEVAWCLTALAVPGSDVADAGLAGAIARRLIESFNPRSSLMPHWPAGANAPFLRRHVTCFADIVYPIQALSHYHIAAGMPEALDVARRCARRMCDLQGPAGQWWWHYDVRTGRVLERYPVYSVHQDAMAPMALAALRQAGGHDHSHAINAGLAWLAAPPELASGKGNGAATHGGSDEGRNAGRSLIDTGASLIWRKVARREPRKLSRTAQALASRLNSAFRTPGLALLCRPTTIDHESRPYHMAWILHAWGAGSLE